MDVSVITWAVLSIVRGEENAECINDTILVLIPTVSNPTLLSQFRSISLCNVFHNIASKVLTSRFKMILPEIISEEQPAFVPGRLSTSNIISTYECLHFMKISRAKTSSHCALKMDMMKAYDMVEWDYLQAIMEIWVLPQLGFSHYGHGKLGIFSSLFSGSKLEQFKLLVGIQRGDPISPYILLLAV